MRRPIKTITGRVNNGISCYCFIKFPVGKEIAIRIRVIYSEKQKEKKEEEKSSKRKNNFFHNTKKLK